MSKEHLETRTIPRKNETSEQRQSVRQNGDICGKPISYQIRKRLCNLLDSQEGIAKNDKKNGYKNQTEIAKLMGVSTKWVKKIKDERRDMCEIRQTGPDNCVTIGAPLPGEQGGFRGCKMTEEQKQMATRIAVENPRLTLAEISKNLNEIYPEIHVSQTTIWRVLKAANLQHLRAKMRDPRATGTPAHVEELNAFVTEQNKGDKGIMGAHDLFFMDETAVSLNEASKRAWGTKGNIEVEKMKGLTLTIGVYAGIGLVSNHYSDWNDWTKDNPDVVLGKKIVMKNTDPRGNYLHRDGNVWERAAKPPTFVLYWWIRPPIRDGTALPLYLEMEDIIQPYFELYYPKILAGDNSEVSLDFEHATLKAMHDDNTIRTGYEDAPFEACTDEQLRILLWLNGIEHRQVDADGELITVHERGEDRVHLHVTRENMIGFLTRLRQMVNIALREDTLENGTHMHADMYNIPRTFYKPMGRTTKGGQLKNERGDRALFLNYITSAMKYIDTYFPDKVASNTRGVWDNAPQHGRLNIGNDKPKKSFIHKWVQTRIKLKGGGGIRGCFFPPVRIPDYNPAELLFAFTKGVIRRRMKSKTGELVVDDMVSLIDGAFAEVTEEMVKGWVKNACYIIPGEPLSECTHRVDNRMNTDMPDLTREALFYEAKNTAIEHHTLEQLANSDVNFKTILAKHKFMTDIFNGYHEKDVIVSHVTFSANEDDADENDQATEILQFLKKGDFAHDTQYSCDVYAIKKNGAKKFHRTHKIDNADNKLNCEDVLELFMTITTQDSTIGTATIVIDNQKHPQLYRIVVDKGGLLCAKTYLQSKCDNLSDCDATKLRPLLEDIDNLHNQLTGNVGLMFALKEANKCAQTVVRYIREVQNKIEAIDEIEPAQNDRYRDSLNVVLDQYERIFQRDLKIYQVSFEIEELTQNAYVYIKRPTASGDNKYRVKYSTNSDETPTNNTKSPCTVEKIGTNQVELKQSNIHLTITNPRIADATFIRVDSKDGSNVDQELISISEAIQRQKPYQKIQELLHNTPYMRDLPHKKETLPDFGAVVLALVAYHQENERTKPIIAEFVRFVSQHAVVSAKDGNTKFDIRKMQTAILRAKSQWERTCIPSKDHNCILQSGQVVGSESLELGSDAKALHSDQLARLINIETMRAQRRAETRMLRTAKMSKLVNRWPGYPENIADNFITVGTGTFDPRIVSSIEAKSSGKIIVLFEDNERIIIDTEGSEFARIFGPGNAKLLSENRAKYEQHLLRQTEFEEKHKDKSGVQSITKNAEEKVKKRNEKSIIDITDNKRELVYSIVDADKLDISEKYTSYWDPSTKTLYPPKQLDVNTFVQHLQKNQHTYHVAKYNESNTSRPEYIALRSNRNEITIKSDTEVQKMGWKISAYPFHTRKYQHSDRVPFKLSRSTYPNFYVTSWDIPTPVPKSSPSSQDSPGYYDVKNARRYVIDKKQAILKTTFKNKMNEHSYDYVFQMKDFDEEIPKG